MSILNPDQVDIEYSSDIHVNNVKWIKSDGVWQGEIDMQISDISGISLITIKDKNDSITHSERGAYIFAKNTVYKG